ncbi:CRUM1 protein, partial [Amia calva]|nr:CRUM1 protein [Amia calva]
MNTAENSSHLVCQCPPSFPGELCAAYIQQCANSLCENETHCQHRAAPEDVADYRCICREGFRGAHCEVDVNECASNPCQNRAVCRDRIDGYSCYCVPGFQGKHCEIEVNECASQPCQNGATCLNKIGKYVCLCVPGYTGTSCELQIDECQSEPCFNGASCRDYLNGYSCTCAPGFEGDLCEVNTDECRSQPCHNGARCVDAVNGYSCDCSTSGFMGRHCETPVPPCMCQPCLHNGTCEERNGSYTCSCWPGFLGKDCEEDIDECSSNPCQAGQCLELSRQELYGTIPELPVWFDYQRASGFVCRCPQGFKGRHSLRSLRCITLSPLICLGGSVALVSILCQDDVNECDASPCQNGGICENTDGGYICHCLQKSTGGFLYGGQNCSEALVGCENHNCENGGTCAPLLRNGRHEYSCLCPNGYAGSRCRMSTTFSFEVSGYFHTETPLKTEDTLLNVTLSFRTVLPNAVLFHRGNEDIVLKLELVSGHLLLTLQKTNELSSALELPHNVTDGAWHAVETTLGRRTFGIALLDDSCLSECQAKVALAILNGQLEYAFLDVFIGGLREEGNWSESTDAFHTQPYFIGCLRDVYVDSQLIIPANWSSVSGVNVSPGCSNEDRCVAGPCQNRGRCVNLWQSYYCECHRPYEGQNCSDEYVTARFGKDNSEGYALFTVDDSPGQNVTVSMFVRTRRRTGLLLLLTNRTGHYLRVWLEDGKVQVQVHRLEILSGDRFVSDGHFHLLSVEIRPGHMALYQSAQRLNHTSIRTVRVQTGDVAYVGGLSDRMTAVSLGGYFKGCIQDLRINTKRLEFYPIGTPVMSYSRRSLVNVTRGCAGDDSCSDNPCQNGGVCYSMWDDFTCTCPTSTAGRTCEQVQWCELAPCPAAAVCQPRPRGFECVSNATFHDDSGVLHYEGNGKISGDLVNITFSFRTRNREAGVLHSGKGPEFVTVSIHDSHLLFELRSGNSFLTSRIRSQTPVSDGRWHKVMLSMMTPTSQLSKWVMVVDNEEQLTTTNVVTGNLNFLREGTDILLGGLGPGNFTGCLSTVEIGGISLPHFGNSETHLPRYQEEQFIKTSAEPALIGCAGADVCAVEPCLNGGRCEDLFNLFNCTCSPGWTGPRCEINIDNCASNPCIHGNCSHKTSSYECDCHPGYTGRSCELEIDECANHKCGRGATCLDGINRYSCLCPENMTGPRCDVDIEKFSWYLPKFRFPKLPKTVCVDDKKNFTCFNGGNCSESGAGRMCRCLPGFSGDWCEMDIDECRSDPCLNGGFCRNMLNKYQCICDVSFAGEHCEVDVSDISFFVSMLLWQNLFQLLSYLILHLEDDPEVEWGEVDE